MAKRKQIRNGERLAYRNIAHMFYVQIETAQNKCYYCGGVVKHLDHVPPISYVVNKLMANKMEILSEKLWLVPACFRCNVQLGAIKIFQLEERKAYLLAKLLESTKPGKEVKIIANRKRKEIPRKGRR